MIGLCIFKRLPQKVFCGLLFFAVLLNIVACSYNTQDNYASEIASNIATDQEQAGCAINKEPSTDNIDAPSPPSKIENGTSASINAPEVLEKLDTTLMEFFQNEYFSGSQRVRTNLFLASEYTCPEDIDLLMLFYCGIPGEEHAVTLEERLLVYDALAYSAELDITKYPVTEVETILKQYTGLTLEETNRVNLSNFVYLEEYDAFYLLHGDTLEITTVEITAGYWDASGNIILEYELPSKSVSLPSGEVVLMPSNDGQYYIVSNTYYK